MTLCFSTVAICTIKVAELCHKLFTSWLEDWLSEWVLKFFIDLSSFSVT